jgi:hypothetical protein
VDLKNLTQHQGDGNYGKTLIGEERGLEITSCARYFVDDCARILQLHGNIKHKSTNVRLRIAFRSQSITPISSIHGFDKPIRHQGARHGLRIIQDGNRSEHNSTKSEHYNAQCSRAIPTTAIVQEAKGCQSGHESGVFKHAR